MNLAASNLAWPPDSDEVAAAILRDSGATGVELAPGKSWQKPLSATDAETLSVRRVWESRGLQVVAFQALIFGRPELQLFGPNQTRTAFLDVLERLFRLAAGVGAGVLVFGSPRNRARGDVPMAEAWPAAVAFFRDAAERAEKHRVRLVIEANPPEYGCDFVTHLKDAAELVREVNRPGFALHGDAGGMILTGDTPESAGGVPFAHFHVSEPDLSPLGTTPGEPHAPVAAGLRRAAYAGWVSVEVRQPGAGWEDALRRSLAVAREWYGGA